MDRVRVFELKHADPGLRQRSRGYVRPGEGVGNDHVPPVSTLVGGDERVGEGSPRNSITSGSDALLSRSSPLLVSAQTGAWVDTGSLEATFRPLPVTSAHFSGLKVIGTLMICHKSTAWEAAQLLGRDPSVAVMNTTRNP